MKKKRRREARNKIEEGKRGDEREEIEEGREIEKREGERWEKGGKCKRGWW